jgi:hypothetical protein
VKWLLDRSDEFCNIDWRRETRWAKLPKTTIPFQFDTTKPEYEADGK